MANRTGPALAEHDQGNHKIGNLGRGALPSDAARRDELGLILATSLDDSPGIASRKLVAGREIEITAEVDPIGGQRLRIDAAPVAPEVEGATLYPACIPAPLYRPEARAILTNGALVFGFVTGAFVPVDGAVYTWRSANPGPQFGEHADGYPALQFNDGDYFGIVIADTSIGTEDQYYGLYRWIDCGIHYHDGVPTLSNATFVRVDEMNEPGEFVAGSFFQVTGAGARYQGQYFVVTTTGTIALDTTPLSFTLSSSVTAPPAYELLTGPQLVSEGASSTGQTIVATLSSGTINLTPVFATLAGTPGLPELPAGKYKATAMLRVLADNPAAVTTLGLELAIKHAGGSVDSPFLVLTSPPIRNTRDTPYPFEAVRSTPVACSPTDMIQITPIVTTDSATSITVYFSYQDPTRATRIVVPFLMPSGTFAGFHNDLGGRSNVDCHPEAAITPGIGAMTATVSGVLTMPTGARSCIVSGAEDMVGIATAGLPLGVVLRLFFTDPRNVLHLGTVGTGVARFHFCQFGTGVYDVRISEFMDTLTVQLMDLSTWGLGLCWVKV